MGINRDVADFSPEFYAKIEEGWLVILYFVFEHTI